MEGTLKRKISFFTGYQDKWFVLADDGNIKQFDRKPAKTNQKPKWTMNIILADVTTKDDGLRFVVTASNGRTLKLKAPNKEEREKWTKLFKIINEKHFPLIYAKKEDEGGFGPKAQEPENVVKSEVSSDEKRTHELFKNMSFKPKRNYAMVAAIDFGSAYSGTAFSFKSEFIRDPLNIHVMEGVGTTNNMSSKIPTVLLLNPDKKFVAFGNEAEEKYASLTINDQQYANQCYYFTRFKMQLYNNRDLKKSLTIKDISGKKEMKAVDVFAACIEHLKNATFTRVKQHILNLEGEDIHWVLTVPAIWTEAARQFMIDAAEKSGIYEDNLTLALEPEAAALCCRSLEIEKKDKGQSPQLGSFSPGSRFLVVDLGGGTVDITANEVMATGQIKEIHSASGGPWGGNMINTKIWNLLREIFGTEVLSIFALKNREDYLDLVREIERQKRSFRSDSKCRIGIPSSLTIEVIKSNPDMIADKYKGKAEIKRNKLQIIPEVLKSIFKEGIDKIIGYVQKLLNEPETSKVKSILLVGGYASCGLLVHAIKEHFNHLTVICPLQPDVIVLKGAVIMGHMETPIVGRMAKYHYGIAFAGGEQKSNFDGSHTSFPTSQQEFYTIIPKGSPIQVNEVVTEYDFPIDVNQEEAKIQIYASEDKQPPKLISEESCRKIGHIRIKLPQFRRTTKLRIGISNDETEFKVVAREEYTGKCFVGTCRFLD
ncbi:heat shock 70 kDa protein 12A-like isoform X2 [Mytilus californianus]|uniref:heat shock 70 kDa protein 12A-like isoform X2 n=1 Tax=Mytilus californianus TaxID=6549 RepID=UPI002247E6C7|nr:heat shock 70 kDa protein 12A-like isoform X2 [Mytilus californianus]XP_052091581.1 heat shock 70 kDa protein 12A-like isoform X2 [Mytilus californianus]